MSAIVFDLDGTLIDSAPDIHASANGVLADEGLGEITLQQARSFIGHGAGVFVSRLMAAVGLGEDTETHDRILGNFLERYETEPKLTRLYPNVAETLHGLKDQGFTLGLCTNKPLSPTKVVLRHFDLLPLFDVVIGGDSLPVRKPDPGPLNTVFLEIGQRGLFVGDSEVDAETAQRAAVPFALYTEGYRKTPVSELYHSRSFQDFADLPAIAATLLNRAAAE